MKKLNSADYSVLLYFDNRSKTYAVSFRKLESNPHFIKVGEGQYKEKQSKDKWGWQNFREVLRVPTEREARSKRDLFQMIYKDAGYKKINVRQEWSELGHPTIQLRTNQHCASAFHR